MGVFADVVVQIKSAPATASRGVATASIARPSPFSWWWANARAFSVEALQGALDAEPGLPRGLLLDTLREGWLDTALELGCVAVVCNYALWDGATVAQVHDAGMRALSYTVNDEWAAERLLALGTDGIITDRVDRFSPT